MWSSIIMKMVSILELKARLSALVDQASKGARVLITRHKRPVAFLQSADLEHLHVGKLAGKGSLKLSGSTAGSH
jgi:prevent-host-death family protein